MADVPNYQAATDGSTITIWFDWDPIGVQNHAPRDEYQSYLPEIYELVKANADRTQIAKQLFEFETKHMGLTGSMEKCLAVSDKILAIPK
jgi:hypothetical protein